MLHGHALNAHAESETAVNLRINATVGQHKRMHHAGTENFDPPFALADAAAFAAAGRIDDFAYVPQQNIGHATTTLMAQNRGAGKKERVRASFFCGLKLEFLYAIFITAVCFFFAEPIIRLFVTDAAVVHLGVRFLKLVSLFYLMPSLTNGIQGGFRGLGDLKITLNSSTLNMAGRVAAAAVFVLLMKMDIEALPYSYVVGWILMLVYEAPMMVKYLRKGEL